MKSIRKTMLALALTFAGQSLWAQGQSPTATPNEGPAIREMIVKAFVAKTKGTKIEHGRMIRISVNRYDTQGRILETMSSTGADTLAGKVRRFASEKRSYRYDTKGKLVTTVNRRQDGSVIDSVKNKPTDKPVVPDWYGYKSLGKPLNEEVYTYDKENNWVKIVTYENGKPSRIVERVINYY